MKDGFMAVYNLPKGFVAALKDCSIYDDVYSQDKYKIIVEDPTYNELYDIEIGEIDNNIIDFDNGKFEVEFFDQNDYNAYKDYNSIIRKTLYPEGKYKYDLILVDMNRLKDIDQRLYNQYLNDTIQVGVSRELGELIYAQSNP